MRSAWIEAERSAEVRKAARDWKEAGAIDGAALDAVEAEFPHRRLELAWPWKVLVFVLVSVAIVGIQLAVFGLEARGSARFLVYAVILAAATEVLRGSRIAGTGSDAATSFWAVMHLIIGSAVFLDVEHSEADVTATLLVGVAAWAVACWRWGFALYGAFAAIAGFVYLARFPSGRLAWLLVGAALCPISAWLSNRPTLAPSRRRAFAGIFVVSAIALYGAVNLYSRDRRIPEEVQGWAASRRAVEPVVPRAAFVAGTALVPIVLIAWGLRARRRLVLDTGAVLGALSLLTLHYYLRFGSVVITAFGLAVIGFALWLNRLFSRAPGGEIGGFTASPLFSVESEATGPAAALVAAAASPISPPHSERDFSPGGGRAGGGGATGTIE
jgi:hypothetical protein